MSQDYMFTHAQSRLEDLYQELNDLKREQGEIHPERSARLDQERARVEGEIVRTKEHIKRLEGIEAWRKEQFIANDNKSLDEKLREREKLTDFMNQENRSPEKKDEAKYLRDILDNQIVRAPGYEQFAAENPQVARVIEESVAQQIAQEEKNSQLRSQHQERLEEKSRLLDSPPIRSEPEPEPKQSRLSSMLERFGITRSAQGPAKDLEERSQPEQSPQRPEASTHRSIVERYGPPPPGPNPYDQNKERRRDRGDREM